MAKEVFRFYDYLVRRIDTPLRHYNPIVQDLVEDIKFDIENRKGITRDKDGQEIVLHIAWRWRKGWDVPKRCPDTLKKLVKQYKHYCRSIGTGYEKIILRL